MGLFDIVGGIFKGEKAKLQEILENNPRPKPDVFIRLIKIYREENQDGKAIRVAKRGAALYPEAMEIVGSQEELARVERELEKKRLRQRIESFPNAILYGRLAELYKSDGQIDESIKVCEAGIKHSPEYGGTHLVLGQIHFDKGDLEQAVHHLQTAVELDKYNYLGLKLLAQCFMKLGRPKEATPRLKDILNFAPGDEAVITLLKEARESAGESADETMGAGEVEAKIAARRTERTEKPAPTPAKKAAGKASHREQLLNESMTSFTEVTGVTGAIVVDPYGLVIASELADGHDEELTGALVTNIYRTTVHSAEQLQIGGFEDGLIEGDDVNVNIVAIEDMVLAIFTETTVKMGLLQKAIRDFVAAAQEIG
jgi:predicted regulator of Ras-like GTPase activity (Roadblock/LC7/MglB family)